VRGWFWSRSAEERIAATLVTLIVVLSAAAFAERLSLGTWPFADKPDRLSYCGATYSRSGMVLTPPKLYPAFTYSAPLVESRAVFTPNPPGGHWGDTPLCTGELYLRAGHRKSTRYSIDLPG
jgi:hypothetical protein